jgi:Mrp family chromosome partitioning ATPase
MILASKVDGILMVVRPRHTRRPQAQVTMERIKPIGTKLIGVVLNRIPVRDAGYYAGSGYRYAYPDNGRLNPKPKKATDAPKKPRKPLSSYADKVTKSFKRLFEDVNKLGSK